MSYLGKRCYSNIYNTDFFILSSEFQVTWAVYKHYLGSMNPVLVILTILLILGYMALNVYSGIWLAQWTEDPVFSTNVSNITKQQAVAKYISVYAGLGLMQGNFYACFHNFTVRAVMMLVTSSYWISF